MSDINNKLLEMYLANGATSKNISMAERECLISQGAADGTWATYLAGQGYTGSVNDMMYKFLGDKGYTAQGLNERWYQGAVGGGLFAVPFDPNTLFVGDVYGDFMRVSESTVQSSGGLLTRWPGLRAAPDLNGYFDMMPYASAPSVGAYGPNGEQAIRFSSGTQYVCSSYGRGGAEALEIPGPYWNDTLNDDGFFVAARIKSSGNTSYFYMHMVDTNNTQVRILPDALYYTNSQVRASSSVSGDQTEWNTYACTRLKDGTCKVYFNGTPINTGSDPTNRQLYRWLMWRASETHSFDVSAYAMGHVEVTDEQIASLCTWMEG